MTDLRETSEGLSTLLSGPASYQPPKIPIDQALATKNSGNPWNRRIAAITTATFVLFVVIIIAIAITSTSIAPPSQFPAPTTSGTQPAPYPIGTPNKAEASGLGPPISSALSGYRMTYSTEFAGGVLPAGWNVYHGQPANDPGAQFGSSHVVVSNGVLRLNTWRDPQYQNRWVTGGLCQCGLSMRYGAYFVRSRITGGGASSVQLLYPTENVWPPEVDFNESAGQLDSTTATLHYGPLNREFHSGVRIAMRQWHTWGVIWTPKLITYTVDGQIWSSVSRISAQIPNVPMHLALQQQTWCFRNEACPSAPVSMLVNWVAEYQRK
jgi:Glycosyl hydrolases family 16